MRKGCGPPSRHSRRLNIRRIGERHPEYGVVQAMGVTGGEAYRWFVADDGVVTMIPLSMLEDEPD